MKRKILIIIFSLILIITSFSFDASAADGNMDGGGGDMGSGSGGHGWNEGWDGVRITVIDKEKRIAVGTSFDWLRFTAPAGVISFAKKNKLQYQKGSGLAPLSKEYVYYRPTSPLPQVISSGGGSNIAAVKSYFTDKEVIKLVAKDAKIGYESLISGKFTIMIEPIAVFKYNGVRYAMTATEAALYDRQINGKLKGALGYLTHQNQPLAMYLETSELGISPGGGGGPQSNEYIIKTLGIGTVNFNDEDKKEEEATLPPDEYDYEYHADTWVITSINVCTTSEINPDRAGRVTFYLPSGTQSKEYVIPANECQLVWVKWKTPETDETEYIDIPVDISGGDSSGATITVKIVPVDENTPPDPQGRDRNDEFSMSPLPTQESVKNLTWGEWWATWHPNWVWQSESCDSSCDDDCNDKHGYWEDQGWWDFFWRSYQADLNVEVKTYPDERVPTSNGNTIKSGYGINAEVEVYMTTNGGAENTTEVQYVSATFPEFNFETYNRLLEPEDDLVKYITTWQFKENEYSQFNNRVHFTPIWYPDGASFPVCFTVLDAWTPAGQVYYVINAEDINVQGNVYDDWHIAPNYNTK